MPLPGLPGFVEEYPEIGSAWLSDLLQQAQASGVVVVENSGQWRTQQIGHSIMSGSETELTAPLILLEPGCTFRHFRRVLEFYSRAEHCKQVTFALWNQDRSFVQVTSPQRSHVTNYPEYGLILFVETGHSSAGQWHFRWGNPEGKSTGSTFNPIEEEAYPWTEVATLDELIVQLSNRFTWNKTIHLRPAQQHYVGDVVEIVDRLHQAGFFYVDLAG